MNRAELERLDREALIARAHEAGVSRPGILTRPELVDELLLRSAADEATKERSRGLFGRARDLLARLVERGLNLPDAAERIRSLGAPLVNRPSAPAALPTVTLAEIYAAQGHRSRAVETLERVLVREPEHGTARALLAQLSAADYHVVSLRLAPEQDEPAAVRIDGSNEAEAAPAAGDLPPDGGLQAGEARPQGGGRLESSPGERPGDRGDEEPQGGGRLESSPGERPGDRGDEEPQGPRAAGRAVEPSHMLDDSPLPPRYDVDECVAIPVDPSTVYVYWEIRDRTLEYVRAARPASDLVVRVVMVAPTWDGPRSKVRDYEAAGPLGELFARDLPAGCIVRVAIGLRDADRFVPIAHSPALQAPPGAPCTVAADALVRWTPGGIASVAGSDADAPAIGRAVGRVRRQLAVEGRARPVAEVRLGASERWIDPPAGR